MSNGLKIIWCKNCSSVIKFEQTNNEKNEISNGVSSGNALSEYVIEEVADRCRRAYRA